jgi:hypothetical protein
MHNNYNYNRKGPSFLQRALEFIGTLKFCLQWKHLRRRRETPNYLYLKRGARDLEYITKEFSNVSNIKSSKVEVSVESLPELNSDELFEPSLISVNKRDLEESAETEQHQVSGDSGHKHNAEDCLVSSCPVTLEQIEKSLPMSFSMKSRKKRGAQGHGQDGSDQMSLPFG